MICAILLHFLCVSGPETHEKCNEIAQIVVFVNVPIINKVQRFVQFRFLFRAFQALKRTKNATKLHKSLYFVT